jgi:hypothetical protein
VLLVWAPTKASPACRGCRVLKARGIVEPRQGMPFGREWMYRSGSVIATCVSSAADRRTGAAGRAAASSWSSNAGSGTIRPLSHARSQRAAVRVREPVPVSDRTSRTCRRSRIDPRCHPFADIGGSPDVRSLLPSWPRVHGRQHPLKDPGSRRTPVIVRRRARASKGRPSWPEMSSRFLQAPCRTVQGQRSGAPSASDDVSQIEGRRP